MAERRAAPAGADDGATPKAKRARFSGAPADSSADDGGAPADLEEKVSRRARFPRLVFCCGWVHDGVVAGATGRR